MLRNGFAVGIVVLFIVSSVIPMTVGYNVGISEHGTIAEKYSFDRYFYPEYYNCYNASEIPNHITTNSVEENPNYDDFESSTVSNKLQSFQPLNGLMDSPWPMYCHDTRHTGRSPYSSVNTWDEIWNLRTYGWAEGGPVIDENGILYIGAYSLYAVFPNGTLKWKYNTIFSIVTAPAIDDNGVIYFGTVYGNPNLFAVYTSNSTLKWKFFVGNSIFSSPVIGTDGTIYFGDANNHINALYPNGTLKWRYTTDHVVYSSPAISPDGTIYCGCHDTYLYALYPNNGTLKWKYKTGDWIRTSPSIGDDGTIYVVSLDCYLYAVYPDGTLRWKTNVGAGTSPTTGQDGTIYCGYDKLYAINPMNGSVKWTFDVDGTMRGGTPCNSVDGTIYVGTSDGGELIAINPDGTLKWRKGIGTVESPPAIGSNGTVYVGSDGAPGEGFLHAFGIGPLETEADGPYYGLINQPVQFSGSATGGYRPYSWLWDFGDGQISDLQNPIHTYINPGNYTVTLTATDNSSNTSSDSTWAKIKKSNNPPNKPSISGPTHGEAKIYYDYTFVTTDPDNDEYLYYYVDWGENSNTGWIGPYTPGKDVIKSHRWLVMGIYTIKAKARDNYGAESNWGILRVTMPKVKTYNMPLLKLILERFPHAFPILQHLLKLQT